ncbi:hypothetical protein FBU30_009695 [Linnemannia zychae]|nr:hypothetical protein FBU30_009695 [Linnemannia zychae]
MTTSGPSKDPLDESQSSIPFPFNQMQSNLINSGSGNPSSFDLSLTVDDLFSMPGNPVSRDLSNLTSVTPSSSVSQSINDDPDEPPKVPEMYFEARRVLENGVRIYKFYCLHCNSKYAKKSGGSTLTYHFKTQHRPLYKELIERKQNRITTTLHQTVLTMASIPKIKRDKIYMATLEWLIGDLLPFTTLDSTLFRAMVNSYIFNIDPPYSATIRSLLFDNRIKLTARLQHLISRTLVYGAITVESWMSKSNRSYLGVSLHWLDENFRPYECALDMAPQSERHTAA